MTNKVIAIITVDEGRIYFDLEDMHDVYEQIELATRNVYSFITRIGGNIVGQTRGDIICELDIDAAMQLKDLIQQIKTDLSKRCYIGIGEDTREASLALDEAKKSSQTGIKVYDPSMESKELSKAEKKLHALEPEHKQKIAETIKVISQNKQILDQLKQEKPEIYDGISDLIRVMAMIIASDKMQKKDHLDKMASTINDHLDKTHEKFKQAKSNEVEKLLNQAISEQPLPDGVVVHDHHTHPDNHYDSGFDHFGNRVGESFNKSDGFTIEILEKGKKDILPMFGAQPESHHHEFADWASKALPNKDWQIWSARAYRDNPKQFTPEVKQKIEHFGGSVHIPEVAKVRFDKTHDLNSGLKIFNNAEKQYNERIKSNTNLVTPTKRTQKVISGKTKANRHWFGLGVGACSAEGKTMGHCGNVPSKQVGDKILSLRTEHNLSGKTYHEPHLTFISNEGLLGEMKGRANKKPTQEYHKDIVELLKDKRIKGLLGGGYEQEHNFQFSDLSPEHQKEVIGANPNLITDTTSDENIDKLLNLKTTNDKHSSIKELIAKKTNLDAKHHEKLVNDKNQFVREAIARNPNLDAKHHEKLVNDEDQFVRRAIAENPNLDAKHHEKLVNDKNQFVRRAIARNPNLDAKHHEKLVNDEDETVRRAIARNPNLDAKHHEKLVNDEDETVREAIAQNPSYVKNKKAQKSEGNNTYVNHSSSSVCDIHNSNVNDDESKSSGSQMQKSEMPKEVVQKVIGIIQNLENNKDVLEQIYSTNPDLGEAFATIVSSMEQMMQEKGIHLESHLDQAHAQAELENPHAETSDAYHGRKQIYPVGAIRQDRPGHERVKQPDGSWKTISGKPQ